MDDGRNRGTGCFQFVWNWSCDILVVGIEFEDGVYVGGRDGKLMFLGFVDGLVYGHSFSA